MVPHADHRGVFASCHGGNISTASRSLRGLVSLGVGLRQTRQPFAGRGVVTMSGPQARCASAEGHRPDAVSGSGHADGHSRVLSKGWCLEPLPAEICSPGSGRNSAPRATLRHVPPRGPSRPASRGAARTSRGAHAKGGTSRDLEETRGSRAGGGEAPQGPSTL
jgi:hypothetical protein